MNVVTDQKPIVELTGFNGLYARGAYDNCPLDHLTDCMNCSFPGPKQVTIREPVTVSSTLPNGRQIISYFIAQTSNGSRLLTLNANGQFYDESFGPTLLGTFPGADDFTALNIFGRTYISFKTKGKALVGTYIQYYDGTNFGPIAGYGPASVPTLAQVNPGNVGPGVYGVAVAFLSPNGYLSPPYQIGGVQQLATITATGVNDIEISNIPTVPNTVVDYMNWQRVILVTQANQTTLFFYPGGTIANNTATTFNINFYDTSLVDSADYLNDITPAPIACSSLKFYNGRMIAVGSGSNTPPDSGSPDQLLLSDVDIPESFNAVSGTVIVPVDYGANTSSTALVILGVLYVLKPNGTYSTQDNGGDPDTWSVTIVDSALGAWDNGVSLFASSASAQDVFDSSFIVTQRGLMIFQAGTYQTIPLTKKIESLWNLVDNTYMYKVQIAHDVWSKRVYIAIPLTPPFQLGLNFTAGQFLITILMMDYQEGLGPDQVKWSTWTSVLFRPTSSSGISKLSFENFTLSYSSTATIIYQLAFCIGDNNIYKIIVFPANRSQNYTQPYIPDQGVGVSYSINQYIITPPILPPGGGVYVWLMLNMRIYGYGGLFITLFSKDRSISSVANYFNMTSYVNLSYDLQRLINFTNEGLQVAFQNDQSDPYDTRLHYTWWIAAQYTGFFQLTNLGIYGTKLWSMRPALVESS
jgi:hypothetical protein